MTASPEPYDSLVSDLSNIVGPDWVRTSLPDRLAYNNDCWPRGIILTRGQRVYQNLPIAIVQPENEQQIQQLVAWAQKTSTPIIPYGAGSGVCGGAVSDDSTGQSGIIIDLKRLNKIIEIRPDDMLLRAQPGVIGMILEKELERQSLTMGHFPSSLYCSSLGGYLAARSAGQTSSRYGKIEDMVRSLRVVTGTGELLETAPSNKHLNTPDLTQLFVGSEGTLGLITEATLRIEPAPTHRFYRGFRFANVEQALNAIREMMQTGLRPAVVRLYDAFDSLIAGKPSKKSADQSAHQPTTSPNLLQRLQNQAATILPATLTNTLTEKLKSRVDLAAKSLLGRAIGQPLVLNALVDVLPEHCMLVIGFDGTELIEDEANFAFDLLGRYGLDLGPAPGFHWLENRFNVSYKQSPMFDTGAFIDTMEVSTTWSNLNNLYTNVRAALSPHVFVMAHFSHLYTEGSSIYFTFAGFGSDVDESLERYQSTWKTGLDAVARAGGSIAHHHGVGLSKAPWTHHDHPGGPALFEALKNTFDPSGIMNPGKVYA